MAQAIAKGAIEGGVLDAADIIASDPSDENRQRFAGWGCETATNNASVVAQAQQVMLAVKPQVFEKVAPDLAGLGDGQVLISIMAGLGSVRIAQSVGKLCRVIRVMPNTPAMVGAGMTGVALGDDAEPGDEALTHALFRAVGEVVVLPESMIDSITAISGSGPAYLFYIAEAMQQAANDLGLGEHGRAVVAQTLMGAGKLLAESGEEPAELRRRVTSPGGTTLAATTCLDVNQVHSAFIDAIKAAYARAKELGG